MQIPCPLCGLRDSREFTPKGHETYMHRPSEDAAPEAWNDYLHNRENPAGPTRELWYHGAGCTAWLVVERNTVTHAISGAQLAAEVRNAD
ncbi:MAG: sarcosine oxidase subunit delta [Roseicyclus sp.]|jgi:sarcosine oxidase subunit delta